VIGLNDNRIGKNTAMTRKKILPFLLSASILLLVVVLVLPGGDFRDHKKEKAVTDYLLTQSNFSWKTVENSRNFCVIENLNFGSESFPLYVWALCEEFTYENGVLKGASGTSVPLKINYPNELADYDPAKFSYEAPGDGEGYSTGIKNIFPIGARIKMLSYHGAGLEQKIEKIAREDFGR
jgi:hypothetical protein